MDKRKATNDKAKSLAYVALFAALTLVLGYLEATIPLPVAIPGVKLGLANVAVLIALYLMGPRWACGVMLVKVVVTSLVTGLPSMIAFSLAGSALAFLGMLILWRADRFNLTAVSVVAALLHNAGQLGVAMVVLQTPAVLVNAPVMVIAACITGTVTGAVATGVMAALPPLSHGASGEEPKACARVAAAPKPHPMAQAAAGGSVPVPFPPHDPSTGGVEG